MRHQIPDGEIAKVVDRALDLLIAQQRNSILVPRISPERPAPRPRSCQRRTRIISARLKPRPRSGPISIPGTFPMRSSAKCWRAMASNAAKVSPEGRRCQQRERLQFNHKHPYGQGGHATVDNIAVRCRPHNLMHADDDYGRALMRRRIERGRREREASRFVPESDDRVVRLDRRPDADRAEGNVIHPLESRALTDQRVGPSTPGAWVNWMDIGTHLIGENGACPSRWLTTKAGCCVRPGESEQAQTGGQGVAEYAFGVHRAEVAALLDEPDPGFAAG
jgi:hypothetical protein